MSTPATERPDWACQLHPAPRRGGWAAADRNYRTCSGCLDRLRDALTEVRNRYAALDPRPGNNAQHGGRGAPGFGSRSPASDHVIAMRDTRSRPGATMWRGSDRRVHREPTDPPLSVHGALVALAHRVAAERGITNHVLSRNTVDGLTRWIDSHLDWITRQADVATYARVIHRLAQQLRPVTGEPGRHHVGTCPNIVDDPDRGPTACNARLYAPLQGDTITCRACERQWPRPEWERLGKVLTGATA